MEEGLQFPIFGSGKSIPRFNMESNPDMSISDWIQLFNDVQDIRGVSVPTKVKDLKALLSGSVRSWLDDYLKQEGYNDAFVNANRATDEWFSLLLNKMQSMYSKDDQLTIDLGMNHPIQGDDEHVMTYYAKCSSYYKQRPVPISNEERIREFLRHMKPKLKTAILQASHTMPSSMEAYLDIAKRIETVQRIGENSATSNTTVANPLQSLLGLNSGQINVPTVQASATPINQATQPAMNVTAGTLANALQTVATNKLLTDLATYQKKNKPNSGSVVGVVESTSQGPPEQEANNQLVPILAGLTGNYLLNPMQSQVSQLAPNQSVQQNSKLRNQNQNSDTRQDQNIKHGFEMFTKVMATLGGSDDKKVRQTDDLVQALKQRDRTLGQRRERFGDYEPIRQPVCHYCQKPGHLERQCFQKMKDRQQQMEHGSSNPSSSEGRGRTGNQYAFSSRSGGSFSGQGGNYPREGYQNFGRRGYNNQYQGGFQSRDFVPPSYSSQLDYVTRDQKGPQAQAELSSQSQAPSGNRFRQGDGGNNTLNQQ